MRRDSAFHQLNARVLRARVALALGKPDDALAFVEVDHDVLAVPSMRAEVLSTRAMCFAALARPIESREMSQQALKMTTSVEILVQTKIAEALLAVTDGREDDVGELAAIALETDVWDPVLCVLRSNPALANAFAKNEKVKVRLERLYAESRDHALARRSRLRIPATSKRLATLSPREHEILGLMAEGFKTADIASSLFISQSTVKVHVRHIFEKLGVRTRAEAVNRLNAL
jgi:ATP/maltotriose-dependent transcriptional regulator MalT